MWKESKKSKGACPEQSRRACPEQGRRACPEQGRRACPEQGRRACPEQGRRVSVAMSGGVDSSVAALLLKKQGYEVVGVFMKFWQDTGSDGLNAKRVCAKLNIPFLTWDFQKEFKKAVVDDFISGYKKGITPNPCVVCNQKIKFGLFLKKALKMGADYIATGHYVRLRRFKAKNILYRNLAASELGQSTQYLECSVAVARTSGGRRWSGRSGLRKEYFSLYAAKDKNKDQSYFLWTLTQKQLKHCLFPIGDYTKEEVRSLARKYKLPVASRESQEVCFIKNADLYGFLRTRIHADKGDIIELKTGKKIGEHQGVYFYTIGQRAPVPGIGPYYVIAKNLKKNQLLVVKKDSLEFFCKEIMLENVNWISGQSPRSVKILVRTRYRQPLMLAEIFSLGNKNYQLKFIKPKEFIFVAPGQSAVFYNKNGELLGGGIIKGLV